MASPPPDKDRVVCSENVSALINTVMMRHQLKPQDIKDHKKCILVVHGRGDYKCIICNYPWRSHFSWIKVDLKDQRILYRWSMKCKMCLNAYKPTFSVPETDKLIEKAVYAYKGERYIPADAERRRPRYYREPHHPSLCEKCGWGQTMCWIGLYNKH